jgi:sortase A
LHPFPPDRYSCVKMTMRNTSRFAVGLLAWAERLLLISGALVLGWCALIIVEQHIAQYVAHESLVTMPRVEAPAERAGIGASAVRRLPPPTGTALADLSIPRVHLSAVVLHGSDARTLRLGVGHIENTAFPGEPGNVAIAGHRDSFFRPLRNIQIGDEVLLDTPRGRVRYRVSSFRVVSPTDVSVLKPTTDSTLTLVTCYPFWVLGHAPDRFIVRAVRVSDAPTTEAARYVSLPTTATSGSGVERIANPTGGPAPNAPSESRPVASTSRRDVSDETLVRQAIERFRLTYNARFARVGEERPGGQLRFRDCESVVDGDRAVATCQTAPVEPQAEWRFTLQRASGGWTIRSLSALP